jgi:hypothetical protein
MVVVERRRGALKKKEGRVARISYIFCNITTYFLYLMHGYNRYKFG